MIDFDEIKLKLQSSLSPKRFLHTLGVVETAEKLAEIHNVDKEKAVISAFLHDCAKDIPESMQIRFCKEFHIRLDEFMKKNIALCHSFLGAEIAKREYGIKDEEILNAIRFHTTGRKNMTKLEKLIYLADYIEPNRKYFEGLKTAREYAKKDLDKAMILVLTNTIEYIKKKNGILHPLTLEALEYLKSEKGEFVNW
ncbi:MAG TPA: bis(5'-nucleosyl)-tetraphosphatase (symmetrical) YqeK [Defluviitaleaceae bacterium]|jgi:nicotinate-nucleotide adenylyltransferase|nr:HD domain-containing protein [Candidatus Epulonipiscium sp.]HOA80877.1 bis(5'-nucleosyl)-tetraphosphatase (symmetrical) YqeK [Defluviitaleaceae bacterium]